MTITSARFEKRDDMIEQLGSDGFGDVYRDSINTIYFLSSTNPNYRGGVAKKYRDDWGPFWIFRAIRKQHPGQVVSSTC